MKNRTFILLMILPILLFCVFNTFAQDFWMQRSYKRWTREEIIRIISDSPWAQVRELEADSASGGTVPSVTIRLRSAVPIRQALVRLKQIEANYDKMDTAKRAEFDEKMKGTLDCPACQENYVVTISPPITKREVRNGVQSLMRWKFEQFKGYVYLQNDKGEKRPLVYFAPPLASDGEASFFFARLDENGKPLLDGASKTVTFVFEQKNQGAWKQLNVPLRTSFDVTKMQIDGKPEF